MLLVTGIGTSLVSVVGAGLGRKKLVKSDFVKRTPPPTQYPESIEEALLFGRDGKANNFWRKMTFFILSPSLRL